MSPEEKEVKTPDAPELLRSEARPIYDWIYGTLKSEDRSKEKYKHQVAIAANALYFYRKVSKIVNFTEVTDIEDIGLQIRALNSASMEWTRAAKVLLLTPESEIKIQVPEAPPEDRKTFAQQLDDAVKDKVKKNYGHRTPPTDRKAQEKRYETRKKTTNDNNP